MSENASFIMIYVTFPEREEAESVSRRLLEKRMVACANIFPAHGSMYRWEGRIENAEETAVIYKTRSSSFDQVKKEILERHSYECPCIVALPLVQGHAPFFKWIENETE